MLSSQNFIKSQKYILKNARQLDISLFNLYFNNASLEDFYKQLKKFQNKDFGFGNALEQDIKLPNSSNIATTIAFQYIKYFYRKELPEFLNNSLDFLANNFSFKLDKWLALPAKVDNFPHASWWHFNEKKEHHVQNWVNPTVEIIGYLLKYSNNFDKDVLKELKGKAISLILSKKEIETHDLQCYLRFFDCLGAEDRMNIQDNLLSLLNNTIQKDTLKWQEYVPKPLDFIKSPESHFYDSFKELVDKNLQYLISKQLQDGSWQPAWEWETYEEVWKTTKPQIAGQITAQNLIILDNFGLISKSSV